MPHPRARLALAPGHVRQVGLDVGDPLAIALCEAHAPARHARGVFEHLRDVVFLDCALEQRVDCAMARDQVRLERPAPQQLAQHHRGP
jgi:hypothetical protein